MTTRAMTFAARLNDWSTAISCLLSFAALLSCDLTAMHQPISAQEEARVIWSYKFACCIATTALMFEVALVIGAQSPRIRNLYYSCNPKLHGLEDARCMSIAYGMLALCYGMMAMDWGHIVHLDVYAFGGPRPVYTLRYLEWSITVPILMAISCSPPSPSVPLPEPHRLADADDSLAGDALPMNPLLAPLWHMPLAASARCTSAYIWASWLALVVDDVVWRWVLLNWSFIAFVFVTVEQVVHCYYLARQPKPGLRLILLVTQVLLFTWYGVVYLLAVFGLIDAAMEQLLYTCSDMSAKVFHSMMLVRVRNQEDLAFMCDLRNAAVTLASDLSRLIKHASAPIFWVNCDLRVVAWNHKVMEITGVPSEQAMGQPILNLVADNEAHLQAVQDLLQRTLTGEVQEPLEMHLRCQAPGRQLLENVIVMVSATPQRNFDGKILGVVCIGQDVTEQLRHKRQAELVAADLTGIVNTANAPILGVDLQFSVTEWNLFVASNSGFSKDEVVGKELLNFVSQGCRRTVLDVLEDACKGRKTAKFELELMPKDIARPAVLLLNATPRRGPLGDIVGVICVGQDITDLKQLDERKSSLMAMVTHELKSPLHGMIGLSHSLLFEKANSAGLTEAVRKPLSMIHSCAKRLLDLVANMMDASLLVENRQMRLSHDPVQVEAIVEEVLVLCQQSVDKRGHTLLRKGVRLVNAVRGPLPVIEADSYRVTQLLYNLVTNALKFTHEGSVTVSAAADDFRQVVTVDVKDTGIGIAPENLERIFLPFDQEDTSESRRYEGLGLGLSICREIAEKHGGTLTVQSQLRRGSTFRVTLPYQMNQMNQAELGPTQDADKLALEDRQQAARGSLSTITDGLSSPSDGERPLRRGAVLTRDSLETVHENLAPRPGYQPAAARGAYCIATMESLGSIAPSFYEPLDEQAEYPHAEVLEASRSILSVDDDPAHQEALRSLLAATRHDLLLAADGTDCLRILEESKPLPDLLLLDLTMHGISGLEVLARVRKTYSPLVLPIIVISAVHLTEVIVKAFSLGCNDYVQKPFGREELLARVRIQLHLKRVWLAQSRQSVPRGTLRRFLPEQLVERLASGQELSETELLQWRAQGQVPALADDRSLQATHASLVVAKQELAHCQLEREALREQLEFILQNPHQMQHKPGGESTLAFCMHAGQPGGHLPGLEQYALGNHVLANNPSVNSMLAGGAIPAFPAQQHDQQLQNAVSLTRQLQDQVAQLSLQGRLKDQLLCEAQFRLGQHAAAVQFLRERCALLERMVLQRAQQPAGA